MRKGYNKNSLVPLAKGRILRHLACAEAQLLLVLRCNVENCFTSQDEFTHSKDELAQILCTIRQKAIEIHTVREQLRAILCKEK